MNRPDIDELRAIADQAESEAQEAMRARRAAIVRAAESLKAAGKARQKLVRALAAQGEGGWGWVSHRRLSRLLSPDTSDSPRPT